MARCEYEGIRAIGFHTEHNDLRKSSGLNYAKSGTEISIDIYGFDSTNSFRLSEIVIVVCRSCEEGRTVYLRLRAYLRAGRRAGMRDSDRALRWVLLSDLGASRHEPEVARAQQVLQVPWFLPQHVFPGSAYLSLGIRVTS